MSFEKIKQSFVLLRHSVDDGQEWEKNWLSFKEDVLSSLDNPPYHLRGLLNNLDILSAQKNGKEKLAILDHGCGGGLTLLYLFSIGYQNIWGVDRETSGCDRWNRVIKKISGRSDNCFFATNENILPMADLSIDFIFSQQVLEHVKPQDFEMYYQEEGRVLKRGGIAMHSVPHRLVPYDSHTRTWILHMCLPRRIWLIALKIIGRHNSTAEHSVYLRWPWVHKAMAKRVFGHCDDQTKQRLLENQNFEYYDGSRRLRAFIGKLARSRFLGLVFPQIISLFIMMDTISKKNK